MLSWLARVVRPCAHGVRVRDVSRGTPVVVCRLASVGGQSRPRVEGPPPQRGSRARVEPIPSVSSACVPRFRQRDCCEPPGGSCGLWDELAHLPKRGGGCGVCCVPPRPTKLGTERDPHPPAGTSPPLPGNAPGSHARARPCQSRRLSGESCRRSSGAQGRVTRRPKAMAGCDQPRSSD